LLADDGSSSTTVEKYKRAHNTGYKQIGANTNFKVQIIGIIFCNGQEGRSSAAVVHVATGSTVSSLSTVEPTILTHVRTYQCTSKSEIFF
jgi:hypothetical protein